MYCIWTLMWSIIFQISLARIIERPSIAFIRNICKGSLSSPRSICASVLPFKKHLYLSSPSWRTHFHHHGGLKCALVHASLWNILIPNVPEPDFLVWAENHSSYMLSFFRWIQQRLQETGQTHPEIPGSTNIPFSLFQNNDYEERELQVVNLKKSFPTVSMPSGRYKKFYDISRDETGKRSSNNYGEHSRKGYRCSTRWHKKWWSLAKRIKHAIHLYGSIHIFSVERFLNTLMKVVKSTAAESFYTAFSAVLQGPSALCSEARILKLNLKSQLSAVALVDGCLDVRWGTKDNIHRRHWGGFKWKFQKRIKDQ